MPINPATYEAAPEGFPNPFKDARFQNMLVFDSETSKRRTDAVDALYDQLISFQLDNLKAATRAIQAAEAALEKSEVAEARALVKEARDLVSAMPVSADEAVSQQIRDAFSGGKDKTARQAELEQQWAAFATKQYAAAKAKAEEALALVK